MHWKWWAQDDIALSTQQTKDLPHENTITSELCPLRYVQYFLSELFLFYLSFLSFLSKITGYFQQKNTDCCVKTEAIFINYSSFLKAKGLHGWGLSGGKLREVT